MTGHHRVPVGIDGDATVGPMRSRTLALVLTSCVVVACTGEEAVPLDELPGQAPPASHFLEPTEEMEHLATQQCLDDPELAQGYIEAVDPADSDRVLVSITIDCDDVR